MITLGGIEINKDMYLHGVIESRQIAFTQGRTVVDGLPFLLTKPTPGGRVLTLQTSKVGGATQGIWCQSVIEAVKELESPNNPVQLNYHDDIYTVQVVDTSNFEQLFSFEVLGPTKRYTGKIITIEV